MNMFLHFAATLAVALFAVYALRERLVKHPAPHTGAHEPHRRALVQVFLMALALRLLMLALGELGLSLTSGGEVHLIDRLTRSDGYHYLRLAQLGYEGYIENGQHLFLVFFPLYPWILGLLSRLFGHPELCGVVLSCLCYALGCVFCYRLVWERFNRRIAADAVLLLSLFPFSFFFGFVMTEGLFLLCSCAALYYIHKHRWLAAGLWGIFAAMCRMTGVLVIGAAVVELMTIHLPKEDQSWNLPAYLKKVLPRLPLLFLPLLGTAVYFLLNTAVDGDPFAFAVHQEHWNQGFVWLSETVNYMLRHTLSGHHATPTIWLPQLLLFPLCLIALFWSIGKRRQPNFLIAYGFAYFLATFCLSWLLSGGRYLSCCLPFFIILAEALEKRPLLRTCVPALFAGGMLVYYALFLSGAPLY